jgi:hypothetical protein
LPFYSDEAWFILIGYGNNQNNRYWSPESPHSVHGVSCSDVNVVVWCAVSAQRIIGPMLYFLWNISLLLSTDWWRKIVGTFYARQYGATQCEQLCGCNSWSIRRASWRLWPLRSPSLDPCDYHLSGTQNEKMYVKDPSPLEELKKSVMDEIPGIALQ